MCCSVRFLKKSRAGVNPKSTQSIYPEESSARHRPMRLVTCATLLACCYARLLGGASKAPTSYEMTVRPTVVAASHDVSGYGPECAADGNEETFWLVPGGQRMEMMSRDKWLVLDVGAARSVEALSLLGDVDSFGAARMMLDAADSPNGPWRRVCSFRALGTLRWQRIELAKAGQAPPTSRFIRLYVRREGHASFRHRVHGIVAHCAADAS
jgi:hypothetical protein